MRLLWTLLCTISVALLIFAAVASMKPSLTERKRIDDTDDTYNTIAGDSAIGLRGAVFRGKPFKYRVSLPETLQGFIKVTSPIMIEITDGTIVPVPLQDHPWPVAIRFEDAHFGEAPDEKRHLLPETVKFPGAHPFEERIVITGTSNIPWPDSSTHGRLVGGLESLVTEGVGKYKTVMRKLDAPVDVEFKTERELAVRKEVDTYLSERSRITHLQSEFLLVVFGAGCMFFGLIGLFRGHR